MRTATVGVLAASALTAQAILLPPGVAAEGGWDSPFAIDTQSSQIKLPCPECVSTTPQENTEAEGSDDIVWIQGGSNDVLLNFSIEHANTLSLNGYILFPPALDHHDKPKPTISQVPSSSSLIEIKEAAVPVREIQVSGHSVFVNEEFVSPVGDSVVRLTYQLISIDNHPVSVPGAEIVMLKSAGGELMILNVEPAPKHRSIFDSLPPHAVDAGAPTAPKKCDSPLMCKFNDMISSVGNSLDSAFKDVKVGMPRIKGGCYGKKLPGHLKPGFRMHGSEQEGRPEHHHGRPPMMPGMHPHGPPHHPHHGHHGHHRHHGHHGMHSLVEGFLMVLIPVMAGITMGMTVSLIGMLIGRLISFLWIKFARGGERGYASVAQEESEAEEAIVDEKAISTKIEMEDSLPKYEDAPAYEEVQSERR